MSSAILIQKLFWASEEGFKIASCVAAHTRYLFIIGCQKSQWDNHMKASMRQNSETNITVLNTAHSSSFHSYLESYQVAIVPVEAFADSSRGGFVERHVHACRAPCILLNLPLRLATVGCTLQWTLGAESNKQLQLLFGTILTLCMVWYTRV